MIEYSGPLSFLTLRGSVFPKAFYWAFPCAFLVFAYRFLFELSWPGYLEEAREPSSTEEAAIGLFTSILGFLIVFRANLAYGRFWEGITLVERACALWLNGISNLVAFSNADVDRQVEVAAFQHLISRLMSLLLSITLSDISRLPLTTFPSMSLDGIDPESLRYLQIAPAKQKVVLQWIQRLVVEKERAGVVDISPPILSRVFQEFSLGVTNFIEARKLTSVPFPFQFAQVVVVMLSLFSTVLMPLVCAIYVEPYKAVPLVFLVVFMFMGIHYICVEIEQPFGGDPNDLPLEDINRDFKTALMTLLEAEAQQTPMLVKSTDEIKHHVLICRHIAEERTSSVEAPMWSSVDSADVLQRRKSVSQLGRMWNHMTNKTGVSQMFPRAPTEEELPREAGDWPYFTDSASSGRALSKGSCTSSMRIPGMSSIIEDGPAGARVAGESPGVAPDDAACGEDHSAGEPGRRPRPHEEQHHQANPSGCQEKGRRRSPDDQQNTRERSPQQKHAQARVSQRLGLGVSSSAAPAPVGPAPRKLRVQLPPRARSASPQRSKLIGAVAASKSAHRSADGDLGGSGDLDGCTGGFVSVMVTPPPSLT